MRQFIIRLIAALCTFLLGTAITAFWMSDFFLPQPISCDLPSEEQRLRVEMPYGSWQPLFFEEINERLAVSKLPRLNTVLLPENDLEVRLWAGFGVTELEGFMLKRSAGQWSARRIYGHSRRVSLHRPDQRKLNAPKSGWEMFWQRLVKAGVLSLPDASAIDCNPNVLDGFSYVVESNVSRTYRTYMYGNPLFARCSEAEQFIQMLNLIGEEFDLAEFKIGKRPL